ncbi:MAG: radical SAM protein [Calditrichia bacterium]
MEVLFLIPPAKNYYGKVGLNLMPLGIGYLASVLEKNGHTVSVIDFQAEPEKTNTVDFSKYDVVGISSDTPRFNAAIELGRQIRAKGVPVVFGGYHATFLDDEAINKGAADFVIRGEGEYPMLELIEKMQRGGELGNIRGLTYKPNGEIKRNPSASLIQDLDELPFPTRNIFAEDRYLSIFDDRKMATVLTSRGCPFDCYFCASSRFAGLKWRRRSLDSVFSELDQLIQQGYHSFIFIDDNFTLSYRRTMDFCNEVLARKWDIKWWCFSRVDSVVKHPDMVRKMAEAGNRSVFLGLESGNQDTLDYFQKKTTLEMQEKAVRILKDNNIRIFGSFILGELHETRKMIKETIKFAKKLNPDTCQFSLLTPYPGSRLFQQMEEFKQLITRNWDLYDGAHIVFKNPNLSVRELHKLFRQAYIRFYMRLSNIPGVIKKFIFDPKEFKEIVHTAYSGFSVIHQLNNRKS